MPYPDDLEWNQPGVEPTQAKKNEGWKPEEKPPAEYFNWFFNRTSQAVKYLKGESDKLIDDAKIGNRTITDTVTATTGANTLTKLLSMLGNMIKRITGKSNWYTAPATTLEDANTHITATSNPHNTTAAQVGAIPNTAGSVSAENLAAGAAVANGAAPGNYGLGANTKNVATTDINTIIVTGWYSGWGDTKTPSPNGGYTLRVESRNANFDHAIQEISHDAIPNIRWTRSCTSGIWTSWRQIATSDQIPTTAAQVGASASMISIPLTAGKWNLVIDGGAHTCFDFYYYHDISNGVFNVRGKFISSNANAGYVLTYDSFSWVTANDLQIKIVDTGSIKKVYFKPYSNSNIVINPNYTSCIIHITPSFDIADNDTSGIYYSLKGSGSYINGKQIATTDITFIDRGNAPLDWNSISAQGSYWVHPDFQVGQVHSAVVDLGMYQYGQLVVSGNGGAIQQTYYTHHGEVAIRMLYSGSAWSPWRKIATADQTTYIVASSLGVNGYRKWSDGYIEQWGYVDPCAHNNTHVAITFPIAFVTAALNVTAQIVHTGSVTSNTSSMVIRNSLTTTGFTYNGDGDGTGGFIGALYYRAIGY